MLISTFRLCDSKKHRGPRSRFLIPEICWKEEVSCLKFLMSRVWCGFVFVCTIGVLKNFVSKRYKSLVFSQQAMYLLLKFSLRKIKSKRYKIMKTCFNINFVSFELKNNVSPFTKRAWLFNPPSDSTKQNVKCLFISRKTQPNPDFVYTFIHNAK